MGNTIKFFDLYKLILEHFGNKISQPSVVESMQEISGILYDSILFKCSLDIQHGYFSVGIMIDSEHNLCNILGQDLNMINNNKKDIIKSFELVDKYCQLRLPDKYLEEFFKHKP